VTEAGHDRPFERARSAYRIRSPTTVRICGWIDVVAGQEVYEADRVIQVRL
jgi:hypothetical protein